MSGLDKNRKRNQTVCFRATPEERRTIEARVKASGIANKMHDCKNGRRSSIMELIYTKVGDYYIPNLIVSEEKRPIGKYGRIRKKYLQEHRSMIYSNMVLSDKLWHHLADVEEQAQQRLDVIIQQMKEAEGVTEKLKAKEQME